MSACIHPPIAPPCPLCAELACECNRRLGPFNLYDRHRRPAGCFTYLDTAAHTARLLQKSGLGPWTLFDRHGVPVRFHQSEH